MTVQTLSDRVGAPNRADPSRDPRNPRATSPRRSRYAPRGMPPSIARLAPAPDEAISSMYRRNQSAVGQNVTDSVRALWSLHIDPDNFSASWRDLAPVLKLIIAQHHQASAADAADFYRNLHMVKGLRLPAVTMAPLNASHLTRVAGAVANGTFYHQLKTQGRSPVDSSTIAGNTLSGAGARFALNGGRQTVMAATALDPDATGWERDLSDNACSYCAAQAAKGPFKPGIGQFRAHDYCHCLAVPVLRGVSTNATLKDEYTRITKGLPAEAARAAWAAYWQ